MRILAPDPKTVCCRDELVPNNKCESFDPTRRWVSGLGLRNGDFDRHRRNRKFIPEASRESLRALGAPVPRGRR